MAAQLSMASTHSQVGDSALAMILDEHMIAAYQAELMNDGVFTISEFMLEEAPFSAQPPQR